MKDELGGQIMEEFVGLRRKTQNYLQIYRQQYGDEKPTATKKCVLKRKPKCQDYKNCLEASQKIQLMQIVWKIKIIHKKTIN